MKFLSRKFNTESPRDTHTNASTLTPQLRRGAILSMLILGLSWTTAHPHHRPAFHRVRAGQTLASVAATYGFSYQYLACFNGIRNPNRLRIGQKIALPHRPNGSERLVLHWPIKTGRLTSGFGPRRKHCHTGLDIAAPIGTPVRAAAGGRVTFSGRLRGYGNLVIVQHNPTYSTAYAHLKTRRVRKGQKVQRGMKLATVGRSGRSTGPHLHFEVRVNDAPRDPLHYLTSRPKPLL